MDSQRPRTRALREDSGNNGSNNIEGNNGAPQKMNLPQPKDNDPPSSSSSSSNNSSSGSSRSSSRDSIERSGMLNNREVKALKMGLELATPSRDRNQLREEEEEKRAADLEKKKRASQVSIPSIPGTDPLMRRFKILLLGDSGVGKTSLIYRWTLDAFNPSLSSTVGVDFKAKKVMLNGEAMQIQVWDTAGQEQFHKITKSYYKGAQGIMLVADVNDVETVDNVAYWMENIKSHASDEIQVVLVGNKTDIRDERIQIARGTDTDDEDELRKSLSNTNNNDNKDEVEADGDDSETTQKSSGSLPSICDMTVEEMADKIHKVSSDFKVPYFETSAKESKGVEEAFISLVKLMIGEKTVEDRRAFGSSFRGSISSDNTGAKRGSIFNFRKNRDNSKDSGGGTPNNNNNGSRRMSLDKNGKEKCNIS